MDAASVRYGGTDAEILSTQPLLAVIFNVISNIRFVAFGAVRRTDDPLLSSFPMFGIPFLGLLAYKTI